MDEKPQGAVCCPRFDKVPWDEKTFIWEDKLFIKDEIPQLFHMPLPGFINRTMQRMWTKAQEAQAAPETEIFAAYDRHHKSEFYLAVTKKSPEQMCNYQGHWQILMDHTVALNGLRKWSSTCKKKGRRRKNVIFTIQPVQNVQRNTDITMLWPLRK